MMRKLGVAATGLLVIVAACTSTTGGTTTPGGAGSSTTAGNVGGSSTTAGGGDGISVADSDLGQILVDPDGFTIYIFKNDTAGESTCNEGCSSTWPPVPADTPIGSGVDAAMFGSTDRTDGTSQLTVGGQPLYRYAPDAAPGDTGGQGIGGVWFAVGPDGAPIEG